MAETDAENASVILARLLRDSEDDCELCATTETRRCSEPVVAARLGGGFVDLICAEHAHRAREQGATVVFPPVTKGGSDDA